jgi:hypothetical protein
MTPVPQPPAQPRIGPAGEDLGQIAQDFVCLLGGEHSSEEQHR